jgi:hypothetical protein
LLLPQSAQRPFTLACAAVAGVLFAFLLVWLFGALIWLEATIAQALLSGSSERIHFFYRFIVPVVDATICGLLVGLALELVPVHTRWLHAITFFLAFYAVQLTISGIQLFADLFAIAPFMWIFPLVTALFLLVSIRLKPRAAIRA